MQQWPREQRWEEKGGKGRVGVGEWIALESRGRVCEQEGGQWGENMREREQREGEEGIRERNERSEGKMVQHILSCGWPVW